MSLPSTPAALHCVRSGPVLLPSAGVRLPRLPGLPRPLPDLHAMRDREGDEEGKGQDAGTPGGAQGGLAGEVAAGNGPGTQDGADDHEGNRDRKSTRLNSSHANISYAVFCLKKKT